MSTEDDEAGGRRPATARAPDFIQEERAHRLAKLDAMRERGVEPYPVRFDRDHTAAEIHERFADLGARRRLRRARQRRRARRRPAPPRRPRLRRPARRDRHDPADRDPRRSSARVSSTTSTRSTSATGSASTGIVVTSQARRAVGPDRELRAALQGAARRCPTCATASPTPRPATGSRYLDLIVDEDSREVFAKRSIVIAATRRVLLDRGFREVETPVLAQPGRRRRGAAVHHPPQRARHRHVPADRAGAAAEAPDRRRHEPGLRGQPRLSQRGPRHAPQPRVHDARGLPGVRRLPRHDGPDRGDHRGVVHGRQRAHDDRTSTAARST